MVVKARLVVKDAAAETDEVLGMILLVEGVSVAIDEVDGMLLLVECVADGTGLLVEGITAETNLIFLIGATFAAFTSASKIFLIPWYKLQMIATSSTINREEGEMSTSPSAEMGVCSPL
jgi:hypothetical protein